MTLLPPIWAVLRDKILFKAGTEKVNEIIEQI